MRLDQVFFRDFWSVFRSQFTFFQLDEDLAKYLPEGFFSEAETHLYMFVSELLPFDLNDLSFRKYYQFNRSWFFDLYHRKIILLLFLLIVFWFAFRWSSWFYKTEFLGLWHENSRLLFVIGLCICLLL